MKSKRRRRAVILLLPIYIAVIAFGNLADRLILFPSRSPINAGSATRTFIPFERGELEIWTAQSDLAQRSGRVDAFVLRFYGNADRADRWVALEADAFDRRAIEVWGVNYPGFGRSTGPARLSRLASSAVTAFDALKAKAGDRPIIVFA